MLTEQGIGVVILAKNGEARLHYDSCLEIKADGKWEVHHELRLGRARRTRGSPRLELLSPAECDKPSPMETPNQRPLVFPPHRQSLRHRVPS